MFSFWYGAQFYFAPLSVVNVALIWFFGFTEPVLGFFAAFGFLASRLPFF
jgi:hypothetical protein